MDREKDVQDRELRLAKIYRNLYKAACLPGEDPEDTEATLCFWHGIGMSAGKAYEYSQLLRFDRTRGEIEALFTELTELVG